MITLLQKGSYKLVGTRDHMTMLYLDGERYHLDYAKGIGYLLTYSKHKHPQYYVLAQGWYRLYDVKDEPKLTDLEHLELSLGTSKWQGYLLLTKLPNAHKLRSRLEPTSEVITGGR